MRQTNLQIAFKLEVFHSYFEDNICRCLQFSPGPATKNIQKRFDCKMRHFINGFEFYINSQQSLTDILNYITKTIDNSFFDFRITSTDANFIPFTELPVNWTGQLLYDTQVNANTYTNGVLQLAETLSVTTGDAPGKLIVQFNDIIKYSNAKFASFNISLQARSTQWQYYFINKSALSLENPAISKTSISFTGPETVLLETGEKAIFFSSGNNLLSLSEVPKYRFDLINYTSAIKTENDKKAPASKTIFKGLPNPSPMRMGITEVNGNYHVSSPMYVYL